MQAGKPILITLLFLTFFNSYSQKGLIDTCLNDFCVRFPSDWNFEKGVDAFDSVVFSIYSPASTRNDEFRENVTFSKHHYQQVKDLNKEAEATITYLRNYLPEFRLISSELIDNYDVKILTLKYSGVMNGATWKTYTRVLYSADNLYNLVFTSPSKDFEKYLSGAEQIFSSFHVSAEK